MSPFVVRLANASVYKPTTYQECASWENPAALNLRLFITVRMHTTNSSENNLESQEDQSVDTSFDTDSTDHEDPLIRSFLMQITDIVLYCIDSILTRHGSYSEAYNHRVVFNHSGGKFVLCVLTVMPDWSRKTYAWYFPVPAVQDLGTDYPLEGSWSSFDFSGEDRAAISAAFQVSTDADNFELLSGVDSEGTSIVTIEKVNSQWSIHIDPIFGAQGPKSKVCELCLHRLDCPCFSPCGQAPGEDGMRKRRLRIEQSAAVKQWTPIPDQKPKVKGAKAKGKEKDLERERNLNLKKSFDSLPKDFKERKARVFIDDDEPGEGLNNESFSDFISPGCRVIRSSALSSLSSGSSKSRVPSPLCRLVAGSGSRTPPRSPGKNYETARQAVANLKLESSEDEMFMPQISFGSLFNLNVHHEIGDGLGDAIENLTEIFTRVSDKIPSGEDVKSSFSNLKQDIKSLMKKTLTTGIPILAVAFGTYRFLLAVRRGNKMGMLKWSTFTLFLITLLNNINSQFKPLLDSMSSSIKKYSNDEHVDPMEMEKVDGEESEDDIFQPQAIDDLSSSMVNNVSTLVLTFFSLQAVNTAPGTKKIEKFLSNVGNIPRATVGVTQIMDCVVEMIQKAINFVRTEILGLGAFTWFEDSFPEVDRWCRKVQLLADESRTPKWLINSINSQRVYEIFKEGNSLFLNKYKNIESVRVRNAVQAYMAVLRKLMVPFEQANISGIAPRMEPVTLFLGGAPGVGKSNITIPLLTEVIMEVLPKERRPELKANYMDFIYNRQTEHQYWDRYYGQIACVFDDFLQKRDVVGIPDTETMDIIRGTNMFPNVLHMAALENKGSTVFTSRIVVCTSNTFSMRVESIQEPEALTRRFTHTYRVLPSKEFCTSETVDAQAADKRLNTSHPDLKDNPLNYDALEFAEMRWDHNHEATPTGRIVKYRELIEILVRDYEKRSIKSDRYNSLVTEGLHRRDEEIQKREKVGFQAQIDDSVEEGPDKSKLNEIIFEFDNDEAESSQDTNHKAKTWHELRTIALNNLKDFVEDDDKECEVDYTVLDELVYLGCTEGDLSDLAHAISQVCTIRYGSFRTIWAFSQMAGDLWNHFVENYRHSLRNNFSQRDKSHVLHQHIRNLSKVLVPSTQAIMEIEMFRFLAGAREESWVSDYDITELEKQRNVFSRFYDYVKRKAISFITNHPFLTVLGTIGTVLAVWKTFSMIRGLFCDNDEIMLIPESGYARKGKEKTHKQRGRRDHVPAEYVYSPQAGSTRVDMSPELENEWVKQGGGDLNAIQQAKRIVQKSTYGIIVPWKESRIGTILFIKGRIAIYPLHYVKFFQKSVSEGDCTLDTEILLRNDWLTQGYKLTVREFINVKPCDFLEKQDITIFLAPNRVHQHADITNMFVPVEVLDRPFDKTAHLIILEDDKSWRINSGVAKVYHNHRVGNSTEDTWRVDVGYLYPFPTLSGDCGSTLMLNNKAISPGKIIGMHVAGNGKGRGLAAALNKELIDDAVALFSLEEKISAPVEIMMEPQLDQKPFDANMVPLFRAERPVSLAGKTKIRRSDLYGAWGPAKTKPAYLRPQTVGNELLDPRKIGLSGYCAGNFRIDPTIVEAIVSQLSSHYVNIASDVERRDPMVFTFEQAVCGVIGYEYCDPIDRTTSPGYPWVLEKPPGFPGKTWWFGSEGEVDISTPQAKQVRTKVEDIITKARQGVRTFHPYVDFPKDERRPVEKANSMKTRSISGCSLDYSIAERMFFLDFSIFIMENRVVNNVCVGINPRSQEWDVLAHTLRRFTPTVAGDFSGFDKTQIAEFLWAVLRIINIWYNDGVSNQLVRTVIWSDVVNSIHLFDGDFLQWIKSLPSGHPLTVIINSLIHKMYVMYCFVVLHPQGLHGLQFFNDLVEIQTYGDDGVYSISETIIPWFNQITLTEAMSTIGLTFTDENKSDILVPFRKLSEVTFLKRGFRYDELLGRYVAPLSLDTILEMPYWTKEGPAPREITCDNVNTALMELSLHGEEVYLFHQKEIIDACRKKMNWLPPVTSYAMNLCVAMNTREEW
jgi:hypothetical protein